MRFNRLVALLESNGLLTEAVDFDSKPGFEKGTPRRAKVDAILQKIQSSAFRFDGMDPRFADGFIAQRVDKLIENDADSQDIADVIVKFMYILKFHGKELEAWRFHPSLTKHSFQELHDFTNQQYYQLKARDDRAAGVGGESKDETAESADEGAELVLETEKYKVYEITSMEASIKYGRQTHWCISADSDSNAWYFYDEYIHYFIIDKSYYDSPKSAPSGTDPSKILSTYPNHKKPSGAKIVVSVFKDTKSLLEPDDDDYDEYRERVRLGFVFGPAPFKPTDENQDINDERITNDDLFKAFGVMDPELIKFFNQFGTARNEDGSFKVVYDEDGLVKHEECGSPNGDLLFRRSISLDDGKLHGVCEKYDKNGKLEERGEYRHGELSGILNTWQNGILVASVNSATGEFRTFHANGVPKQITRHDNNGELHGAAEFWYENGVMNKLCQYQHGSKIGIWKYWRPDGQMELRETYGGPQDGLREEWDSKGQMGCRGLWKNGEWKGFPLSNEKGEPAPRWKGYSTAVRPTKKQA